MNAPRLVLATGIVVAMTFLQPLGVGGLAQAGNTPSPALTTFSHQGKVESVNIKERRLVVNRNSYQVSASARVYGPTGEPVPLDNIRKGIFIAFNTAGHGSSIREVRIIPVE